MKTRLIVARHGNTFAPGETVRRVGITDLPLVDSGLKQGYQLGMLLKKQHLIPDVLFTSVMQRTQQTALQAQLAMGTTLAMQPLKMFNEIDYGPDENQPESQGRARLGQHALQNWEKKAEVPPGWKASPAQIITHWQIFASEILKHHAGQTILVITSNGIARFAPYLTGNFSDFCENHCIKLATGALGILEQEEGQKHWQCSAWNIKE